ncbi:MULTISPECIES: NAD(P)/FAD-dependent oxidoreductase [Gordonia]|uniref:Ferredoxin reductase n=1 Tax=Gordonia paraffinivorans NBRC 108238 TaxID=1223543 RepID=A0ABQ0IM49_9ACTN|nr:MULTISPECIES: FAD-dependent oxidoreductase [Gordonia]ASR02058.1 Rhodocoxin reductase [Gordonia rubripertincta]GAC84638.1 putative ferredoxin reductase [Gordonia paraffinivorans NBRC 108238]
MSGSPDHVVVVGASLAGLRAVQTAREAGFQGKLTLVGEEVHLPYDRPPLSKEYLAEGPLTDNHQFPDVDSLGSELGVDLQLGVRATGLDVAERQLTTTAGTTGYDRLLIATGVTARTLPGTDHLSGVHVLRRLDDAQAIRGALDARARVVVIGAGFIGAEVASAAVARGLEPIVLEAAPTPLVRAVGESGGQGLSRMHARHGVDLRCGVAVAEVLGDDRVSGVRLADGSEIPADLVVVGIGADPATGWLSGSGLTVDNGIVCDPSLRAAENVWAAGDVARWTNPLFDTAMRLEHWTNAGEQAVHAMENLLDPAAAAPYSHVPYFWSDWYGQRIQFAGLPIGEPEVVSGSWDTDNLVALYRDGDRLIGALAVNRRGDIMKYRVQISRRGTWEAALAFAAKRNAISA